MRTLVLALTLLLPACHDLIANQLITPPNLHASAVIPAIPALDARELRIPVGPPNATLAAWLYEPTTHQPRRATILLLHGILANHDWCRKTSDTLRAHGYRTVLLDLRAHGNSSGDFITFGPLESKDLVQVTDYLQKHNLANSAIGVYGCSYGAAVAIQYAALDPRVKAVVAVAPFSSLRSLAPHYAKTYLPFGSFLSPSDIDDILARASQRTGYNLTEASALKAIQSITTPVLLIHGNADAMVPLPNSQALHDATPTHSELRIVDGAGHMDISLETYPQTPSWTADWFNTHLPPQNQKSEIENQK